MTRKWVGNMCTKDYNLHRRIRTRVPLLPIQLQHAGSVENTHSGMKAITYSRLTRRKDIKLQKRRSAWTCSFSMFFAHRWRYYSTSLHVWVPTERIKSIILQGTYNCEYVSWPSNSTTEYIPSYENRQGHKRKTIACVVNGICVQSSTNGGQKMLLLQYLHLHRKLIYC